MPFKKGQGGRKFGAVNKQRPLREVLEVLGTGPDGRDLHAARELAAGRVPPDVLFQAAVAVDSLEGRF